MPLASCLSVVSRFASLKVRWPFLSIYYSKYRRELEVFQGVSVAVGEGTDGHTRDGQNQEKARPKNAQNGVNMRHSDR